MDKTYTVKDSNLNGLNITSAGSGDTLTVSGTSVVMEVMRGRAKTCGCNSVGDYILKALDDHAGYIASTGVRL